MEPHPSLPGPRRRPSAGAPPPLSLSGAVGWPGVIIRATAPSSEAAMGSHTPSGTNTGPFTNGKCIAMLKQQDPKSLADAFIGNVGRRKVIEDLGA